MASCGLASMNEEVNSGRINPVPIEFESKMKAQPNSGNTSLQPLAYDTQQVGSSAPLPPSSGNVNLDDLTRQMMMAGMAALGMTNLTLQRQLGENNAPSCGRINPVPIEFESKVKAQPNSDNTILQPLAYDTQQVGSSALLPPSSENVNLDDLTRQIMMAGMAALGMTNLTLQRQLDQNNAPRSDPFVTPDNLALSSMLKSNLHNSVPDGSGLVTYRAPEIESFVLDRNSGYRFDPTTGLHYDANTGFFINVRLKTFMRWEPVYNTYLRESKRSGPAQNIGTVSMRSASPTVNSNHDISHHTVPNIQSKPVSTLLGLQPVLNQVGKSIEGNNKLQIPADQRISHEGPHMKGLWPQIRSFENEIEYSGTNQEHERASKTNDSKNKLQGGNDYAEPKRTSRTRSLLSDPPQDHMVREGLGTRRVGRSRSGSKSHTEGYRKKRSVSRSRRRKRSRSCSREARNMKRPTRSRSRERRSSQSSGTGRSCSKGRRRSCSRSPNRLLRGRPSRSVSPREGNENSGRGWRERSLSKEAKRKGSVWDRLSPVPSRKRGNYGTADSLK